MEGVLGIWAVYGSVTDGESVTLLRFQSPSETSSRSGPPLYLRVQEPPTDQVDLFLSVGPPWHPGCPSK